MLGNATQGDPWMKNSHPHDDFSLYFTEELRFRQAPGLSGRSKGEAAGCGASGAAGGCGAAG